MDYFRNAVCPVCSKPFTEQDDVVVCPECGAPYHRSCYATAGHCLYEEKHGSGFSYLPEPTPAQEASEAQEEGNFVICPHCHKGNSLQNEVCDNCGTPLPTVKTAAPPPKNPTATIPAYQRTKAEVSPDTDKFRPLDEGKIRLDSLEEPMEELKKELDLKDTMDGFSLKEWLSYIGPSGPLYLFQFQRMSENGKSNIFSLSAALFAPLYFLYRKMWGWGVLALFGRLFCYAPTILLTLYQQKIIGFLPFSADLMAQLGLYATYVDIGLSLVWALFAYSFYRKNCLKNMDKIKHGFESETPPEDSVCLRMAHKGGVSIAAAAIGVLVMGICYLPFFLN